MAFQKEPQASWAWEYWQCLFWTAFLEKIRKEWRAGDSHI